MDIVQFRLDFPEFTDTQRYPDSQITLWSTVAEKQVNEAVWGELTFTGVELYTAHCITLSAQNSRAGQTGGMPGTSGGIANNKTVGSVSVGYDSTVTSEEGAGWWNLTNYGKQYYHLLQLFGMGCIQL